jgi:hypothetical protein
VPCVFAGGVTLFFGASTGIVVCFDEAVAVMEAESAVVVAGVRTSAFAACNLAFVAGDQGELGFSRMPKDRRAHAAAQVVAVFAAVSVRLQDSLPLTLFHQEPCSCLTGSVHM